MPHRDCTIIFVGGASGTGKSTLADGLAQRLGARVVDVDLFWMVLRRAVPPEAASDLHLFHNPGTWSLPKDELLSRYLRVSKYVCTAIEKAVANYLFIGRSAIFEGTWLLPDFAVQPEYDGEAALGAVSSLFLHEPDPAQTRSRVARADGWFLSQPEETQQAQVEMHHRYGVEIKRRAEDLGLPVLESQPIEALLDRALTALDLPKGVA